MSEHTVGVVADDLTGAGDCVVQFARAGWTSHLALGRDLPTGEPTATGRSAVSSLARTGVTGSRPAAVAATGTPSTRSTPSRTVRPSAG